jgi:hypothetical protein
MKIVNPDLATNTIKFIPRLDVPNFVELSLINETTKVETTMPINIGGSNAGIIDFLLEFDFNEGDKYQFKIFTFNFGGFDTIYYRGKIFATTQTPQNYQLTKDLYYYEQ